ncbi:hypothetical protein AMAG_09508 [Allomyces macrogynus ATCC 38327]|uniref:Uncharacterized protein n=1 Tax=Allomyces macrogynus (strain ATCC 38327) TaxID=578462 RepID=A0A0L0SQ49_ALLM3|nr:hypothetical protein AMAG_09508 [Allomyces macrogynus ATCC 38327]|eukprot:KNE64494.1 hypothetical protein AMAG_09508 [Allomyces macrogynus ATCC 38327]
MTELFIDPENPVSVRDYPLPSTLTTLIFAQSTLHDSVHLPHIKWVGGTLPVLPHVAHFSALVETVNELAQVPHTLPNLVNLEVVRTCESCADALRYIPDRRIKQLDAHVLHPRILAQIMSMTSIKTPGFTTVRLDKADQGVPVDRLDLVNDEQCWMLWYVLQQIVPRDSLLAQATDVPRVIEEIGDAIHALVVVPANMMARRALRGAVPVEVVVGKKVGSNMAKALTAIVRPLTLSGYIRGRVLAEA